MARETTTIVTPVTKTEVVLNTFITGREFEYIQEPLMQAISTKGSLTNLEVGGMDISKISESKHRMIEKYVVSVGGSTEKVVDAVLDMRHADYEFVMTELDNISKKNS